MQLIESWATTENPFNSTDEILSWIAEKNKDVKVEIRKIPFDYTGDNWHYDPERGEIRNQAGSFFQIKGLQKTIGGQIVLEQPIIIQNEIGYLGIICKEFDVKIDGLHITCTAKGELLDRSKMHVRGEIKAVTFHMMEIDRGTPAVTVLFDV
jgi:oxidase EvaA